MTKKNKKLEYEMPKDMDEEIEVSDEELDEGFDLEDNTSSSKGRINGKLIFQEMKAKLSKSGNKIPALKAIRNKCIDCCCGQSTEVALCPCEDCALWPFRFGKNPYTSKVLTEEQKIAAAERIKNTRQSMKKQNKEAQK
jgi:hypothetical protein